MSAVDPRDVEDARMLVLDLARAARRKLRTWLRQRTHWYDDSILQRGAIAGIDYHVITGAEAAMINKAVRDAAAVEEVNPCGKFVYWWEGEYEGTCELAPHDDGDHFDGVSWFDDDGECTDDEHVDR